AGAGAPVPAAGGASRPSSAPLPSSSTEARPRSEAGPRWARTAEKLRAGGPPSSGWSCPRPRARAGGRARAARACRTGRRGSRDTSRERLPLCVPLVEPVPEAHLMLARLPAQIHLLVLPDAWKIHQAHFQIPPHPPHLQDLLQQAADLDREPVQELGPRLPVALIDEPAARYLDARLLLVKATLQIGRAAMAVHRALHQIGELRNQAVD